MHDSWSTPPQPSSVMVMRSLPMMVLVVAGAAIALLLPVTAAFLPSVNTR